MCVICARVWRGSGDEAYRFTQDDSYAARLLHYYKPDPRTNTMRVKEVRTHTLVKDYCGSFLLWWVGSSLILQCGGHGIM